MQSHLTKYHIKRRLHRYHVVPYSGNMSFLLSGWWGCVCVSLSMDQYELDEQNRQWEGKGFSSQVPWVNTKPWIRYISTTAKLCNYGTILCELPEFLSHDPSCTRHSVLEAQIHSKNGVSIFKGPNLLSTWTAWRESSISGQFVKIWYWLENS